MVAILAETGEGGVDEILHTVETALLAEIASKRTTLVANLQTTLISQEAELGKLLGNNRLGEPITNTIQSLGNVLWSLEIEIKNLFLFLREKQKSDGFIFLNKKQSLLRTRFTKLFISWLNGDINPNDNTGKTARSDMIMQVGNKIKTTDYDTIGEPNQRWNRIAKGWSSFNICYINWAWERLISSYDNLSEENKHVLVFHDRSFWGLPYSLYAHDWTLIAKSIEFPRRVNDNEYKVPVGPRDRSRPDYIPKEIPTTIQHTGLDWSIITFDFAKNWPI